MNTHYPYAHSAPHLLSATSILPAAILLLMLFSINKLSSDSPVSTATGSIVFFCISGDIFEISPILA